MTDSVAEAQRAAGDSQELSLSIMAAGGQGLTLRGL
jgi:hypothetical protein